ncbi:molybdenum cofactor guanylyltransferase [Candidatus Halobonum tyrrellensis]|uniref:Molybdopterin-guanine dinucleotide biosynthesis protein A n=1 Tax=Candidatus Halobonum tyrrellensis G22 TaxID=1324957 RepID=V4GUG0_9EURY|nr:molybdenum cofactor guanylyltransferase [Candidatus Halobonum tyrrellensis]ESP88776.1 molybdopterin-guanine dinucleotide biosynthesis protein A [Candidatus Halobonum tyrrellensis G22]
MTPDPSTTEPGSAPAFVRGVVLAGGDSSRFGAAGEDKALARVGSGPDAERLLARTVRVLREATGREPAVVVRDDDRRATYARALGAEGDDGESVAFGFDAPGYEGPLGGLFGAVDAVDAPAVFCCGCDMPLLDPAAVAWLVDRFESLDTAGDRVDAVAVAYPDGALDPLHAVYRRERVAALRDRLPPTAGPRAALAELDAVHTVPVDDAPAGVPLGRSTTNVNTVAELAAAADEAGGADRVDGSDDADSPPDGFDR